MYCHWIRSRGYRLRLHSTNHLSPVIIRCMNRLAIVLIKLPFTKHTQNRCQRSKLVSDIVRISVCHMCQVLAVPDFHSEKYSIYMNLLSRWYCRESSTTFQLALSRIGIVTVLSFINLYHIIINFAHYLLISDYLSHTKRRHSNVSEWGSDGKPNEGQKCVGMEIARYNHTDTKSPIVRAAQNCTHEIYF